MVEGEDRLTIATLVKIRNLGREKGLDAVYLKCNDRAISRFLEFDYLQPYTEDSMNEDKNTGEKISEALDNLDEVMPTAKSKAIVKISSVVAGLGGWLARLIRRK